MYFEAKGTVFSNGKQAHAPPDPSSDPFAIPSPFFLEYNFKGVEASSQGAGSFQCNVKVNG
jgi:hypothetical protein